MVKILNKEIVISFLIVISTFTAGCLEENKSPVRDEIPNWDKDMDYVDDPNSHDDSRNFVVENPIYNETWGNSSWAIFGNEEGGNCCEHYFNILL